MSSITDLLTRVSDSSSGRPVIATLASPKTIGATSATINDSTNWTTTTAIHFAIYTTATVAGVQVKNTASQVDYKGTVTGTTISNIVVTGGADAAFSSGATVELTPTSRYAKDLYDGLSTSHNTDGTLKTSAIPDGSITTTKVVDGSVTTSKLATGSTLLGINRNGGVGTIPLTYSTYATFTGTSTGKRVIIEWNARLNNAGSGATRQFNVRVLCDGVAITPASESFTAIYAAGELPAMPYSGMSDSTPSAGSHTWVLQFQCSSSGVAVALGDNYIKVTEVS